MSGEENEEHVTHFCDICEQDIQLDDVNKCCGCDCFICNDCLPELLPRDEDGEFIDTDEWFCRGCQSKQEEENKE